jgi:hypothetical protein
MVEFTLPKNSKVVKGKTHKALDGAITSKNLRSIGMILTRIKIHSLILMKWK